MVNIYLLVQAIRVLVRLKRFKNVIIMFRCKGRSKNINKRKTTI